MKELKIKIDGMMCTGCENRVQNALKEVDGVEDVKADHTTGYVTIKAKEDVSENDIKEKIEDIGYDVVE